MDRTARTSLDMRGPRIGGFTLMSVVTPAGHAGYGPAKGVPDAPRPFSGEVPAVTDQQDCSDDGEDKDEDIGLEVAAGAEELDDDPADQRADEAQAEGEEEAVVLAAGLDEPGESADDEFGDENSDHDGAYASAAPRNGDIDDR